jgi:hypothetical protein
MLTKINQLFRKGTSFTKKIGSSLKNKTKKMLYRNKTRRHHSRRRRRS